MLISKDTSNSFLKICSMNKIIMVLVAHDDDAYCYYYYYYYYLTVLVKYDRRIWGAQQ
jgi:hypothetical protein